MTRVPDGTLLLHIGPFKTGTTALQASFVATEEEAAAQGVDYIGRGLPMIAAAMAASEGKALGDGDADAGERAWARLVEATHTAPGRIAVVSSEFLSSAQPDRIRRIIDDLGPERTHVVITLRPLSQILASQWQQYMQNRPQLRYDDALDFDGWLRVVLRDREQREVTPSFWQRHRHDELVQRWAAVIGAENITAIVVDPAKPDALLRTFEELTGMTEGTLVTPPRGSNRSLTRAEVDLVRAFNQLWMKRALGAADYTSLIRFGAIRSLQTRQPESDEERLHTPAWAVEEASRIGAEMAAGIAASGVRVLGDLGLLSDPGVVRAVGDGAEKVEVPEGAWARFLAGLIVHLDRVGPYLPAAHRRPGRLEQELRARRRRLLADDRAELRARIAEASARLEQARRVEDLSRAAILVELARRVVRRLARPVVGRARAVLRRDGAQSS